MNTNDAEVKATDQTDQTDQTDRPPLHHGMNLSIDVNDGDDESESNSNTEPLVTKEESLDDVSISEEVPDSLQMNTKGSLFRNYLYALKGLFQDGGVEIKDVSGLMKVLPTAMELVEFGYNLDGSTKKKYVLFALRYIIKDTVLIRDRDRAIDSERTEKVKSLLLEALDSDLIGNTIDVIVDATKSKLFINKPIQLFIHRLCSKFKRCLSRES